MKCKLFHSFVWVSFWALLLVTFFTIGLTNNVSATSVSIPFSEIQVCSSDCSDYSFLLVNFDFPPPSVTLYSQVYINGSSILRFNFLANQSSNINQDFYIPIPSSTTSLSINSPNSSSGTFTYELLTSLSSGIVPSGSINISDNGTYDVTQYVEAVVNVPPQIVYGDYHNDLVNIYHAIIICAGVCLVLYFFYAIYRLLIKSTGGWR